MKPEQTTAAPAQNSAIPAIERIAVRENEARQMLGGISRTTLWRLQVKGLIKPLPTCGVRLFSVAQLRRFAERDAA